MRKNRIREIWAEGRWVLNGWCVIPSAFSAEVMAGLGWDALTLDLQHGVIDYQQAVGMFQAISTTDTVPMARIPWNDPSSIMKMLDAGAYGLICPMISSVDEAADFARACRYPPRGYRSSGPVRAAVYAGADYMDHANDEVVAFGMIETAEGLENLDAICGVEELDGLYVGPSDLSLALGRPPGLDREEPDFVDILKTIVAAAKKAGKRTGIQTNDPAYAKEMVALGFDLVTVMNDNRLLVSAGADVIKAMRDEDDTGGGTGGVY